MLNDIYKVINGRVMHRMHTGDVWAEYNPVLLLGELGFLVDNEKRVINFKVGDGITAWDDLPFVIQDTKPYNNLFKIEDYKYFISYDRSQIDYEYGKRFIENIFLPSANSSSMGACSSVRCGNFIGRNYDWNYDNTCSFLIETPGGNGKYSSIGTAGFLELTEEKVSEGNIDNSLIRALPFFTLDALNECGVYCNINVSSVGDNGKTTGTTPKEEEKEKICAIMLPRYIVDNFASAKEAVEYIDNYVSIYSTYTDTFKEEYHCLITDINDSYILEFKNADGIPDGPTELVITKVDEDFDRPMITNFLVAGSDITAENKVDYETVSKYSMGVERYNIILNYYKNGLCDTKTGMRNLLDDLKYTNAYSTTVHPTWLTELVGVYPDGTELTAQDAFENPSKFTEKLVIFREMFAHRSREDGKTWQTVSSAVYDIENRKMYLRCQERDTEFEYSINSITKGYIDSLLKQQFIIKPNISIRSSGE